MTSCPFCRPEQLDVIGENANCLAVRDSYPLSEGHALIIPRRHVASFFELEEAEQRDLIALMTEVRRRLDGEVSPDGWNIGINDGAAAGQTIMHLHLHVIPRHTGDVADPRGGIRWVIPDKAPYWDET